jgi:hypothetical protein
MKQTLVLALVLVTAQAVDYTAEQIQDSIGEYFTLFAGDSPIYREKVTQGKPWLHLQSSNGKSSIA